MRFRLAVLHRVTPVAGVLALLFATSAARVQAATIAAQNFNGLSDSATVTFDMITSGSALTNAGSKNANPLLGMTFETRWFDTRGVGTGPVTPTSDTSDFIGVNSFAGSGAPATSPTGVPVASGVEHNFEFNDGDGRLDLIFDPIDTSGYTNRTLSLSYWIAATGFEATDSLSVNLSDGNSTLTLLVLGELGLEATQGSWLPLSVDIDALGLGSNLQLTVSVDADAAAENIFFDDFAIEGIAVPEPTSFALLGLGGLGMLLIARRQRNRRS